MNKDQIAPIPPIFPQDKDCIGINDEIPES